MVYINTSGVDMCESCGVFCVEGRVDQNNFFYCPECFDVNKKIYKDEVFEDPRENCGKCRQLSSDGALYNFLFFCKDCAIFALTSHVCMICDEEHIDGELEGKNFEFHCHKCSSKQDLDWKPSDIAWHYWETWPSM